MSRGTRAARLAPAEQASFGDRPADRAAGAEQVVHEGPRYPVVSAEIEAGGARHTREWTEHPGAVAVVATREAADGVELYCVRQYRHPVRAEAWEIPAGLLDVEGEPMHEAAARELAEEAGLAAGTWEVLVDFHTTPGGSAEAIRVFWARDLRDAEIEDFEAEAEEVDMSGHWVPLGTLLEAVHDGRVHNPSTVIGALTVDRVLQGRGATRPVDAPFVLGPVGHRG
ncbi:ADP-ribose pyrophosphatase [Kytococcus aerolatus]|uniref:ADP-ribose pyrophosphatase n=1 Tax=Kytococcus aerolatus TaxID=592308 RepID=A0A212SZI9_9MICO|nr:NUDIX hydrolase [Kytococcus aerolatus]SNC59169.1 ADP-ribose pyrophosphatase [Kytococcus aerolatus]